MNALASNPLSDIPEILADQSLLIRLAKEIVKLIELDMNPKVMRTKDVAKYLEVTENEVRRLAKAGEIPHIRIGEAQGDLRFNRVAIDKWMGV